MNRRNFLTTAAGALAAAGTAGATGPHQDLSLSELADLSKPVEVPSWLRERYPRPFLERLLALSKEEGAFIHHVRATKIDAEGDRFDVLESAIKYPHALGGYSYGDPVQGTGFHLGVPSEMFDSLVEAEVKWATIGTNVEGVHEPGSPYVRWVSGSLYLSTLFELGNGDQFLWSLGDDNRTMGSITLKTLSAKHSKAPRETLRFLKLRRHGLPADSPAPRNGRLRTVHLRGPVIDHLLQQS